jgi:hypothetical protein
MEFLQNIDAGTAILLGVGLAALCIVVLILFLGVQIIGTIAGTITGLLGTVTGVVTEPFSCCGCILLIGGIIVCGAIILVIAQGLGTCGTAEAINFCSLLGR